MKRNEVLEWLNDHPQEVQDSPEDVVTRCEEAVHEHVLADTWRRACELAQQRERYWLEDGGGAQASEAFVAREICEMLAAELRRLEPIPEARNVGAYVDAHALAPLGAGGRSLMLRYVLDLARREEHQTWRQLMDFTREKGRELARRPTFSKDLDCDRTHLYAETAARVMHILAEDFARQPHPHAH